MTVSPGFVLTRLRRLPINSIEDRIRTASRAEFFWRDARTTTGAHTTKTSTQASTNCASAWICGGLKKCRLLSREMELVPVCYNAARRNLHR